MLCFSCCGVGVLLSVPAVKARMGFWPVPAYRTVALSSAPSMQAEDQNLSSGARTMVSQASITLLAFFESTEEAV